MKKYIAFMLIMLPFAMTEAKPKPENTLTIELKTVRCYRTLPRSCPQACREIKSLAKGENTMALIESSMALWPKLVMCNLEIKRF